jgi:hypothetical protein
MLIVFPYICQRFCTKILKSKSQLTIIDNRTISLVKSVFVYLRILSRFVNPFKCTLVIFATKINT